MKKRLDKYDPKAVEQHRFYTSVGNHVVMECWNIEFDKLVEAGIVKPYNVSSEPKLKVLL